MKIEAKLWPLDGEQSFKEMRPSGLVFDSTTPLLELDRDIIQTKIRVKFHED